MAILTSAIGLPFFALAQDYTLLEPSVLSAGQTTDGKVDFATYIKSGFKTFLAVVVIIAIVMLTASGLQYITAGSGGGKGEAKNRALAAILGLLIALSAYLILRTINPDLVDLTLDVNNQTSDGGRDISAPTNPPNTGSGRGGVSEVGGGNYDQNLGALLNEQEARDKFKEAGIPINKNPCPEGVDYQAVAGGCTNLNGIPDSAVDGAINMRDDCSEYLSGIGRGGTCYMMINGGTEGGHSAHGVGKSVLDIDDTPELHSYIVNEGEKVGSSSRGDYYKLGNDQVLIEENPPHFHVSFNKYP